jgi:hypothetical protein
MQRLRKDYAWAPNLPGVSLIIFALTISYAAAQTEPKTPPGVAPTQGGTMAPTTGKPRGPTGPVRAPVGKKSPLTKEECTRLGGEVKSAIGICNSGQACVTVDENKKSHAVCISKQ